MDNLTHTLIGLVTGDASARATRTRAGGLTVDQRRAAFVAIGAIGGNLPDLDLLYSYRGVTDDKVAYLLEHRGYTHTILGCLVLALLLYAGAEALSRIRRVSLSRSDHLAFATMAVVSVMLHFGMDALNSYGVHLLWPLDNHWVYGDSVFIIEPLYWLASVPMFFLARTMVARVVIAVAVLAALVAIIYTHASQPLWCTGVAFGTAALCAVGKLASRPTASFTSAALMLGVTAMFVFAGRTAAHRAEALAASDFPTESNIDHVLSPIPSNPFCWDLLLVQTGGGEYIVRHGVLSSAPTWIAPNACPRIFASNRGTAPMAAVTVPRSREVQWLGQFSMSASRLATLGADNCEAYEILQFARAPFATEVDGRWVIGDLRFDRETGLGMSEIALSNPPPAHCRYDVPWLPPREDVLLR